MTDLFKQMLLIQAVDLKNKNIPLPESLKEVYDNSTLDEKEETETSLIVAQGIIARGEHIELEREGSNHE